MSGAAAIVIGASAGAIQALSRILPALPAAYPIPVLVVVHIPPDRSDLLAPLFQARCRLVVKEAEDKEPILPGFVYFGPSDYHLLVEADRTMSLSADEPVLYSRPSIDVLFESAADAYGASLVGVILTGANEDGAAGLRAVAAAGGVALAEDPVAAFAPAMPSAALELCAEAQSMSLDAIAAYLVGLGTS
ncbi:chemotaxis protein CheB [Caulobacter sp. S45]|uniref:chemotaxis protein CheB n=1 Tax=Caulobacter sp. S45 TaxID=1641861 RepID=UPI00131CC35E|nr:chemotaxis protein CheB [Caulobacter sp. S45]